MENIKKSRAKIILKEKPKTKINGKSNMPKPARTLAAIKKIKPIKKAFIPSAPRNQYKRIIINLWYQNETEKDKIKI